MNRKGRRDFAKLKPDEKAVDLQHQIQTAYKRGVKDAVKGYTISMAYILYNELDFPKETIHGVLGKIQTLFTDMDCGLVNRIDLEKTLLDECDFRIQTK